MQPEIFIVAPRRTAVAYGSFLKGYGYYVSAATTISETYSLLSKGMRPATFILDLKPAELGELLPVLRAVGGERFRIIVIGGDGAEASLTLKHGADLFLHKPIQPEGVLDALQSLPVAS